MISTGELKNNNDTFRYIFVDLQNFIYYLYKNKNIEKGLQKLWNEYDKSSNVLLHIYRALSKEDKIYFFILHNKTDVISFARIVKHINNPLEYICTLKNVLVNKLYRGRKICQKTVSILIHLVEDNSIANIIKLYVSKDNESAIRCYKNNDFKIIDERKFVDIDRYKMELRL